MQCSDTRCALVLPTLQVKGGTPRQSSLVLLLQNVVMGSPVQVYTAHTGIYQMQSLCAM